MNTIILIPIIGLLAACGAIPGLNGGGDGGGGESTPVTQKEPISAAHQSAAVTLVEDLPACDANREAQLVYIQADQQFQVCRSGTWSVINIATGGGGGGVESITECVGIINKDNAQDLPLDNTVQIKFETRQINFLSGDIRVEVQMTTQYTAESVSRHVAKKDLTFNGNPGNFSFYGDWHPDAGTGWWGIRLRDKELLNINYVNASLPTDTLREWDFRDCRTE